MADDHDKHDDHGSGGHSHGGGGHGGGHGGGGHAEGEHEGAPEWLISFADMVMLIMGFFVILLAMNMGPKGASAASATQEAESEGENPAMLDLVIALREGFNNPPSTSNPRDYILIQRMRERSSGEANQDAPPGNKPNVNSMRPSDYAGLGATVAFDDSSDLLTTDARATIADLADRVKGQKWIIEVRGHTSPMETFRNIELGLELSYKRSVAVGRALVENGVRWEQLRIAAASDNDRVVGRAYDRAADRANQRVEIIVTGELMGADPYSREASPSE
ncbi:MAG: flagellar motor protein MotB [Planctomycetota bacterium]|nr:flagellar motor protein MotB [Planctomycetota bacterium]